MNRLAKKLSPEEYRITSIQLKREYEALHGHREYLHGGLKNNCELCMGGELKEVKKPNKGKIKRSKDVSNDNDTKTLEIKF